ncbi:MAG: hypothetical protein U1E23_01405 [Reyranellaceae bacterium]
MASLLPDRIQTAIHHARRALPAVGPESGRSFRAWAADACAAEARHATEDFWACVHRLGFTRLFDRDDGFGGHDVPFRLSHEAHACAALVWLAHLQAHETERAGPWCGGRWEAWPAARRRAWRERRRILWSGFLRQVERYRAARQAFGAGGRWRPDRRRGALR